MISAPMQPFCLDGTYSPFALGTIKDGELVIKSLPDEKYGFDEALYIQDKVAKRGLLNPKYGALHDLMAERNVVRFDGGLAVYSQFRGVFLIFDDTGKFKRSVRVWDRLTEEHLADQGVLDAVVLGAQATRDDQILIAARSEDGLSALAKRTDKRQYTLATFRDPARRKKLEEDEAWSLKEYPGIDWWLMDPKSGKLVRTQAPAEVDPVLKGRNDCRQFKFRFKPNGDLDIQRAKD